MRSRAVVRIVGSALDFAGLSGAARFFQIGLDSCFPVGNRVAYDEESTAGKREGAVS